nr:sialoadhesin-like [Danio rerio]|eukprot:XP_021322204.1 sialoadhesin-like [Danio rerio]
MKIPQDIHGLKGSCLVIPCSFSYKSNPPQNPNRVVWYQWASSGRPLVYDSLHANNVITKFRGKTELYGNSNSNCSLLIKNLEQSHHNEKLYTRIDPENIAWTNYKHDDFTSTILIDESPQLPKMDFSGGERMGDNITVTCSAFHTCPHSKPSITLNGVEGSDEIKHESFKDGQWKITLTRKAVVKAESSSIECSVTYHGGVKATATMTKNVKCVHQKITIEPAIADVTEGVEQLFNCTVYHSCQKENPTITWNYENMQVSEGRKTLSGLDRITYSNITFLGAKEDNGKELTCTVQMSGGNSEKSVVLRVKD